MMLQNQNAPAPPSNPRQMQMDEEEDQREALDSIRRKGGIVDQSQSEDQNDENF